MAKKTIVVTEATMDKIKKLLPHLWLAKGEKPTVDSLIEYLTDKELELLGLTEKK